jgi:tetratricopeptide (TPR) repeat protein
VAGKGRKKKSGSLATAPAVNRQPEEALPQSASRLTPWRKAALFILPILLLIIYAESLGHPFYFDDTSNITENPHIRLEEFNLVGLKRVISGGHLTSRPVANLSFALNYLFGGYNPTLYRLVNILIHGLNGLLLFQLLLLTLRMPASAIPRDKVHLLAYVTALIWLVHPLHIQSVTYIVQRMNSLAAMFYLLAMLLYIKGRLCPVAKRKRRMFAGCLVSGLLALGSKEIAITLPFMIWIYEWFFFQDLDRRWFKVNATSLAIGFGSGLMLLLIWSIFNPGSGLLDFIFAAYSHRDFTMEQRLLTEFRVVVFYVSLFLWPQPERLTLLHDFPLSNSFLDPLTTIGSLLFLLLLAGVAIRLARNYRLYSFCLLWFLGNLVLESSVIGLEIIFEHRTYLPSTFLTLLVVLVAERFLKLVWLKRVLLVVVFVLLSFWTYQRNQVWEHKVAFWLDCLEKCPAEIRIHNNLGQALEDEGRIEEAMVYYRQAIEQNALFADAYNNLGLALEKVGEEKEAVQAYRSVLKFDPANPDALYNLGSSLGRQGRTFEAMRHLEAAHKYLPSDGDPDVHNNMGIILAMHGRLDESIEHFIEALRINPNDSSIHNNLAMTYARKGDLAAGKRHFQEALRLDPGFEEARNNLLYLISKENGGGK